MTDLADSPTGMPEFEGDLALAAFSDRGPWQVTLEEARWRYAEDNGLMTLLEQANLGFIIIDMRLRFRDEVVEGDRITVSTQLLTLGSGSGEVEQLVRKEGQSKIALKSLFHFILVDRETRTPVPIEGDIRQLLLGVIANPD